MKSPVHRTVALWCVILVSCTLTACGTDANDIDISDVDLSSFQVSISVDGQGAPGAVRAGVTAIDENGDPVKLQEDEIRIFESKDRKEWVEVEFTTQRRESAQIPISAAVAMDYSGSMSEEQQNDAEDAVVAFSEYLMTGDRMAIIKFANQVKVMQDFTDDKGAIEDAVKSNDLDGFQIGTAVWDAAKKGVDLAKDERAPKCVVVTSDGEDNMSDTKASELIERAVKSGVPIFSLGFSEVPDSDGLKYLYKVSEETGGLFWTFQNTGQMEGMYKAIADAFDDALVATWPSSFDGGTVYVKVEVDADAGEKDAVSAYNF